MQIQPDKIFLRVNKIYLYFFLRDVPVLLLHWIYFWSSLGLKVNLKSSREAMA